MIPDSNSGCFSQSKRQLHPVELFFRLLRGFQVALRGRKRFVARVMRVATIHFVQSSVCSYAILQSPNEGRLTKPRLLGCCEGREYSVNCLDTARLGV